MIHAYDKVYLEKAQTALGRMLDFAVYDLKYTLCDFFELFLASGIAARFERGDYTVIAGMSGVELGYLVLEKANQAAGRIQPRYAANRSPEYWTGWALAYYQWYTALRFEQIAQCVPIDEILRLYAPYHEMDLRHFCDKMNALYQAAHPDTNLKTLRVKSGLSQRALSEISGVPLRTIQQYEQRQKHINKAQAEYLLLLAQALCCDPADLLEKIASS